MALRDIKQKIVSVKKTAKVTKAMESVSAVKMRKSQQQALSGREYALTAFAGLKRILATSEIDESALLQLNQNVDGKTGVLLISSDKGLAGAINTNLFKKFDAFIADSNINTENLHCIVIGKKARDYVVRKKYHLAHYFEEIGDSSDMPVLEQVSKMIEQSYTAGECKDFHSIYTMFINTTEQQSVVKKLLPLSVDGVKDFIKESTPNKGKFSNSEKIEIDKDPSGYRFEPSAAIVFSQLLPYLINTSVYYSLLESKASEHSARMVAMKNATDKAGEVATDLKRTFNKKRQAIITSEISEITAGMETTS